jgi:TetR/AcrR family transcriptional regulator, transcriptional repressor for nem operon
MYHYFPDKDDLVQAVISYQADVIAGNQRQADLGSGEGLRAWRDMVIAQAGSGRGQGGCPLGSLAGQLAETDLDALAVTLLATLQGGLLLAQVQRDPRPLEIAVDTLLQLARSGRLAIPAGNEIPLRDCPR